MKMKINILIFVYCLTVWHEAESGPNVRIVDIKSQNANILNTVTLDNVTIDLKQDFTEDNFYVIDYQYEYKSKIVANHVPLCAPDKTDLNGTVSAILLNILCAEDATGGYIKCPITAAKYQHLLEFEIMDSEFPELGQDNNPFKLKMEIEDVVTVNVEITKK